MLKEIKSMSDSDSFYVVLESESEKLKYWFRATEICSVLFGDKSNGAKYVKLHCKDWQYRELQVGMGRPALYVCESGVYRLILRSKSPEAVEFQDWLTEEVLPKLRVQGGCGSGLGVRGDDRLNDLLSFDPIEVHWGNYQEAIQTIAAIREISRPLKIADRHIRDKFVQFARRERMDDFQTEDGWAYRNRPRVHFFLEPDRDICDIDVTDPRLKDGGLKTARFS